MATVSQPEEFLKRKFLFLIIGILILGSILSGIIYYRSQIQTNLRTLLTSFNTKPQITPKIISQGKISDLPVKDYPVLFYANLEYDPKTQTITPLSTKTVKGYPLQLRPNLPTAGNNKFIYKVEVLSDSNKIIQSGWGVEYKEATQTKNNNFQFKVAINYQPKTSIKIYLPDGKVIWTKKIS